MRFQGVVYRAHDPKWAFSPLSGEGAGQTGGRFNPKGKAAFYAALTIECMFKEATQGFARKFDPLTVCSYEVDCEDIVELRPPPVASTADAPRFVATSLQTTGEVRLEDGKCGIFACMARRGPPPAPTHSAPQSLGLAKNARSPQYELEFALCRGNVVSEETVMPYLHADLVSHYFANSSRSQIVFVIFVFLAWFAILNSNPGIAREFAPVGATGDFSARDMCPDGQYLVGMRVRSGAWIDQISITCAPVKPDGLIGAQRHGPARGGNGGSPSEGTCTAGKIVSGLGLLFTEGNRQVLTIDLTCRSTTGADQSNFRLGQEPPGFSRFPTVIQPCPDGEAATGIQGRYGQHVNALGLICGTFVQVRPGPAAGAGTSGTGCAGLAGEDFDICNEHNNYRAKHGVPALTWSADLARNAQQWVNDCHRAKNANNDEYFCHQSKQNGCGTDPNYHFGENLSFGWPSRSGKEAVRQWYCEVNVYNFDNPSPKLAGEDGGGTVFGDTCDPANNPKKVTGHFTQVVWRATMKIGCAKNTCSQNGNEGTLWACEYDPQGNFNVDQEGVLNQNVPRAIRGFAATMAAERSTQTTTAIISDVDLYDIPGGVGNVIGILRQGQTLALYECRADDWCRVAGGWVWGSFLVRNHVH